MRTEIAINTESGLNYDVIVTAKLKGTTNQFSNGKNYQYNVTVKVGKLRASFVYNTSVNDFNHGKAEMDEKDLQSALYCFLSDATAGKESFEDFCGEFGYDTDSRKAEKIHRECQKSAEKAERLFVDIYEVANALNELENA